MAKRQASDCPRVTESLNSTPADISPYSASADDWDLSELRLSQDFGAEVSGTKLLVTVPVRKPHPQEYVRVRPGEDWRLPAAILRIDEDRQDFLMVQSLWEELAQEIRPSLLVTAINRQQTLFVWPVPLPRTDGRQNAWTTSHLEAARLAEESWIRMQANSNLGAYDLMQATAAIPAPDWPTDVTFTQVLKIAFKGRVITARDHPVLQRLRGEI
jgi:hypothetical protein